WVIIATARPGSCRWCTTPSGLPLPPACGSIVPTLSVFRTAPAAARRCTAALSSPACTTCAWSSRKPTNLGGDMTHPIFSATTLEGLSAQFQEFCDRHQLPKLSAEALLCELYYEEPRRDQLCEHVREFIDIWDEVSDAEVQAFMNQK